MMRTHGTVAKKVLAGGFTAALLGAAILTAPAALADEPIGEGGIPLTLEIEATGELSMTVDTTVPVALTEDGSTTENRIFTGTLPTVTVTDTRSDIPEDVYWSVVGQTSDFTSDDGKTISGEYLGWTPALVEEPTENEAVTAGSPVDSSVIDAPAGELPNVGLTQGTDLLFWTWDSAESGALTGEYKADAELELIAPADEVEAGSYEATLTLSLFENAYED